LGLFLDLDFEIWDFDRIVPNAPNRSSSSISHLLLGIIIVARPGSQLEIFLLGFFGDLGV